MAADDVPAKSIQKAKEQTKKVRKIKLIKRAPTRLKSYEYTRDKLSFGFGLNYSSGDYGTNKSTEAFSVPLRASYSRGDWRVSAQMPYINITGPASVIVISDGPEVIEKFAQGERHRWGNGDLRLTAQYKVYANSQSKTGIRLGSTIKFPVASDDAELSSGEYDYSFFTGAYVRKGRWVTNGRIGYQLMGDTSKTDYNNRLYGSAGAYYRIDRKQSAGFNLSYKQAAIETSDSLRTVSGYFSRRLGDGWRASVSIGSGLSDSSANVFGGIQFTKSFVQKRRVNTVKN